MLLLSFGVTTPFFDLGCYIETLNITVCLSLVRFVLERSGKEKSQSERVLKENENTRTTHKQRKTYLSLRVLLSLSSQKWSLSSSFVGQKRENSRREI